MNIYRISKTVSEFSVAQELDTLWNHLLRQEMKNSNIHFDLENNEPCDVKTKNLNWSPNEEKEFRVKAQICWAGGDWEASICYFRCQTEQRMYFERNKSWGRWNSFVKTVIIPIKYNLNLSKVKGKNEYVAKDTDSNEKSDSDRDLWDEMVKLVTHRLKCYWKEYTGDNGNINVQNTGCLRNLADIRL